MKIAVIGGKLQGVEATYLAHKAGWEVILIDKKRNVPAAGIADVSYQFDAVTQADELAAIINSVDMVLPALEAQDVLRSLEKIAGNVKCPLAFDRGSYTISSSKRASDQLFAKHSVLAPAYWPQCELPVIAKPSDLSGSHGVRKIHDIKKLTDLINTKDSGNWVVQEYLEGPSYSIEVMGYRGIPLTLQVTDLEVDESYDCKRVSAPTVLEQGLEEQFRHIAVKIAGIINLNGIMDVEVINHNGILKVLEIDARLPSQTPTVVYKSSRINMLEALRDVYVHNRLPVLPDKSWYQHKAVIYEHIRVSPDGIETLGEHIMAEAGPLSYHNDFFGADEVLTNYMSGCNTWVATLIITGPSRNEAWEKRCDVLDNILKYFRLPVYLDTVPYS